MSKRSEIMIVEKRPKEKFIVVLGNTWTGKKRAISVRDSKYLENNLSTAKVSLMV